MYDIPYSPSHHHQMRHKNSQREVMYFRAYGWGLSRLLITNNILTRKWDSFESKLEVLLIKYKFELDQKFLLRMTTTKHHEIKPNCVKLAKD